MGLDIVEFVMAVEERFGIAIPDEDAEKIATPGDLVDYVWGRVQQSQNATDLQACLTQRSFHALRRGWMTALKLPRAQFRPEVRLDEIVPDSNRRQIWAILGNNIGARSWPELEYPRPLKAVLWIAPITALVAIYTWMVNALHSTSLPAALVGISSSIGIAWVGSSATSSFKRVIPPEYTQVKDLTRFVLARGIL